MFKNRAKLYRKVDPASAVSMLMQGLLSIPPNIFQINAIRDIIVASNYHNLFYVLADTQI